MATHSWLSNGGSQGQDEASQSPDCHLAQGWALKASYCLVLPASRSTEEKSRGQRRR